jgi:hypothetical protein
MTAPVTYTREQMASAVSDCAVELREKAEAYAHYPRYHRRYTNEANMLDAAATALRQAAEQDAEIAGLKARWEALKAWLPTRRNSPDWTTIGIIEAKMSDLESPPEGV